jgi:HEAT repeat protein
VVVVVAAGPPPRAIDAESGAEGSRFAEASPILAASASAPRADDPAARPDDVPAPSSEAEALAAALAGVREATSFAALEAHVLSPADVRVRAAALRSLALRFGRTARDVLLRVALDPREPERLRAEAARYVGRTGEDAFPTLDGLARSDLPLVVRLGALRGHAELGGEAATRGLVGWLASGDDRERDAALDAVEATTSAASVPTLVALAEDERRPTDARVAAARALAKTADDRAVATLEALLSSSHAPPILRAVSVEGLGRLGRPASLPAVAAACADPAPSVAARARVARSRLEHVR